MAEYDGHRHAAEAVKRPRKCKPTAAKGGDWHLVCITRKGQVSMLKNLDLRTARETYKRLLPDTRPVEYIRTECRSYSGVWGYGSQMFSSSSCDDDGLEKVEIIGPDGVELDPWHGVAPKVVDQRASHENGVRHGLIQCEDCAAKGIDLAPREWRPGAKSVAVEPKWAAFHASEAAYVDGMMEVPTTFECIAATDPEDDEDPDDKRLRKLYEEVPTAFWLESYARDDMAGNRPDNGVDDLADRRKRRSASGQSDVHRLSTAPAKAAKPAPPRISAASWTGR